MIFINSSVFKMPKVWLKGTSYHQFQPNIHIGRKQCRTAYANQKNLHLLSIAGLDQLGHTIMKSGMIH